MLKYFADLRRPCCKIKTHCRKMLGLVGNGTTDLLHLRPVEDDVDQLHLMALIAWTSLGHRDIKIFEDAAVQQVLPQLLVGLEVTRETHVCTC